MFLQKPISFQNRFGMSRNYYTWCRSYQKSNKLWFINRISLSFSNLPVHIPALLYVVWRDRSIQGAPRASEGELQLLQGPEELQARQSESNVEEAVRAQFLFKKCSWFLRRPDLANSPYKSLDCDIGVHVLSNVAHAVKIGLKKRRKAYKCRFHFSTNLILEMSRDPHGQ